MLPTQLDGRNMTLVISLVTEYGAWASLDHRLTEFPDGRLITDSSVKHVILRCCDGCALVSYTGLGRVGRIDLSRWIREVLRGESRTVDESLIDLREQATARIGLPAKRLDVAHLFLAGAFIDGQPWAAEIRNFRSATGLTPGGIQPVFETAAMHAGEPMLAVGGAGRDAILDSDRKLLARIRKRRPSRPEDYMTVLGAVSRRAAESRHPAAQTVSRSCTVVFIPPSGNGVKKEWYGPEEGRSLAPNGFSHLLFGIDLDESASEMIEMHEDVSNGRIDQTLLQRRTEEAARRAVQHKGRRAVLSR